jgi:hypothetical protein
VENIILKNIDGRISKLGVSDYKSYTQQLSNETQIVVEIGGVADLDQAKEIIGKTVELEFKLPNEANNDTQARATLAQKLHDDITINPDKMAELTEGRASENIFYTKFTETNLTSLPAIYQNNLEILNTLANQTGLISPVLEGMYGNMQSYDTSGNATTETLNGYVFFRVLATQSGARTSVNATDLIEVATQLHLPFEQELSIQTSDEGIASGNYQITNGILKYNNGTLYPNQEAYNMRVLAVVPVSTLGLTEDQIAQQEATFTQRITEIKADLASNPEATFEDASEIANGRIGLSEIRQAIPTFTATNTENIQSYSTDEGITYIVSIKESKAANENRYAFLVIPEVDEASFTEALQSKTTYTIEEIFVQDQLSWVTAQTSDGKILNGANFKYASVSNSQI